MSVIGFSLIHTGRDAGDEASKEKSILHYTSVYRAITDTPYDEGSAGPELRRQPGGRHAALPAARRPVPHG